MYFLILILLLYIKKNKILLEDTLISFLDARHFANSILIVSYFNMMFSKTSLILHDT